MNEHILKVHGNCFFLDSLGLISFWALKTFYFSYYKDKLQKLRLTALGIELSVLILFFLPWLPPSQGKTTGWELIQQGNVSVVLLGILVIGSALAFLTKDKSLLKAGSVSHLIVSVLFIFAMIQLMPGTVTLTLASIAPIVASLLLLVGNVVVLLLWQQLQLKKKGKKI